MTLVLQTFFEQGNKKLDFFVTVPCFASHKGLLTFSSNLVSWCLVLYTLMWQKAVSWKFALFNSSRSAFIHISCSLMICEEASIVLCGVNVAVRRMLPAHQKGPNYTSSSICSERLIIRVLPSALRSLPHVPASSQLSPASGRARQQGPLPLIMNR